MKFKSTQRPELQNPHIWQYLGAIGGTRVNVELKDKDRGYFVLCEDVGQIQTSSVVIIIVS